MPQDPQEITNQAIKYLYLSRPKLPKPNFHVILTPCQEWSKSGHILGNAISNLNFPDNSIIFLSEIDSEDGIVLPPIDTTIIFPHSTMLTNQISIDNTIIQNIQKNVPGAYSPDTLDIFENTAEPFVGMPLAIEAARIRKRGQPLCTPILFGKNCDRARLVLTLQNIIEKQGVGIVILNNSLQYKSNDMEYHKEFIREIGLSFLPEILPLFFTDNYSGLTLMTYLAHKFHTSMDIVCEGKYTENCNIFEESVVGISKNKIYNDFEFNNINTRKNIWGNVLNSLKTVGHIDLGYNGSAFVSVRDYNNGVLYNKLSFNPLQDLGKSIWESTKDLFNEFCESETNSYFIDVICIINPESLLNYKLFSKSFQSDYYILVVDNENPQNIPVDESIAKTVNKFDIDVRKAYLYKPFKASLPLDVVLLLHDIDYSNTGLK